MTAHIPVGMYPEDFGVIPEVNEVSFAHNDIVFKDKTGINHDKFSFGLKKSLFNYMHGICFDYPLKDWFDFKIPTTTIAPDYIYNCLLKETDFTIKSSAKILWLGGMPLTTVISKTKKGVTWENLQLLFHDKREEHSITLELEKGLWLVETLKEISISNGKLKTFGELKADFETQLEDFELFWYSKPMLTLRERGLLVL
jgi:hypothetical protein